MQRRWTVALTIGTVALTAFFAGQARGRAETAQAEDEKVFELRKYICNEGKLVDLNARFRDYTVTLFNKHGIEMVGYWVPTDGEDAKNVSWYVLAHKSRKAADASWKAFRDDPEWKEVVKKTHAHGVLVKKVESTYMRAVDFSPIK